MPGSTARKRASTPHQPTGQWIRTEGRLATILRDGCACVWCRETLEEGASFTLDHVIPRSKGGSNHPSNLLTACHRCNSRRGNRTVRQFATVMAAYLNHGITASQILSHVRACLARPLPRAEAKNLIARRGTVAAALASRKK